MNERTRPASPQTRPVGAALWDAGPPPESAGELVNIVHGVYNQWLPIGGLTVGAIRQRLGRLMDIGPRHEAHLGTSQVGDEAVVTAGERLVFIKPAGEKGVDPSLFVRVARQLEAEAADEGADETGSGEPCVAIEGGLVQVRTADGQTASMPLSQLASLLAPPSVDALRLVNQHGVRCCVRMGEGLIVVHETTPRLHALMWMAPPGADEAGRTTYRTVHVALPYVILLIVFVPDEHGRLQLAFVHECFFRNEPLGSLADELLFPALLNCAPFQGLHGRSLSLLCTQNLDRRGLHRDPNDNRRIARSVAAVVEHLFESGFNHGLDRLGSRGSWFTQTIAAKVDPRLASIESWEQASLLDESFATGVPWLRTGSSLGDVLDRMRKDHEVRHPSLRCARDIARVVFNAARP